MSWPPFFKFASSVDSLGLVLDHMGERGLTNLAGKIRAFRGPVPEHSACSQRTIMAMQDIGLSLEASL
jgi:hypothetical protein